MGTSTMWPRTLVDCVESDVLFVVEVRVTAKNAILSKVFPFLVANVVILVQMAHICLMVIVKLVLIFVLYVFKIQQIVESAHRMEFFNHFTFSKTFPVS